MKEELLTSMNKLLENFGRRKINKIEDWQKILFSNKKDLLKLKIPKNTLEVRGTSGSTGESLFIYFSDKAVKGFINRSRKFIKKMKLKKDDLGLILFSYGNFIVGSMTEKACNKEKIPLIPFGSTSTYKKELMIELIKKFKPTVWFSTPSYALKLLGEIKEKKNFS
jgi:phenylacetate-coenzyme A ligase PaaK-like adenylate-forming protein